MAFPLFYFSKVESDSDFVNEQLTGNIHKIAIVPLNFTGRPKKGHLIFDACFECGIFSKFTKSSIYICRIILIYMILKQNKKQAILVAWITYLTLSTIYLFGRIRAIHDSEFGLTSQWKM